jgi:hypothetical protein
MRDLDDMLLVGREVSLAEEHSLELATSVDIPGGSDDGRV